MNLTFVNSTEAWVYLIKKGPSGTFNNNGKLLHDFIEEQCVMVQQAVLGSPKQ